MADLNTLLFEIDYYESRIRVFRDMVDSYKKELDEVRVELSSLETEHAPYQNIE
jgi:hypothetical protein